MYFTVMLWKRYRVFRTCSPDTGADVVIFTGDDAIVVAGADVVVVTTGGGVVVFVTPEIGGC